MTVIRATWLVCDECGEECPDHLGCATVEEARRWARMDGWLMRPMRDAMPALDLCSMCRTIPR